MRRAVRRRRMATGRTVPPRSTLGSSRLARRSQSGIVVLALVLVCLFLPDQSVPDDVLFQLMLAAHEQDITLNQMVEQILRQELEKEQPREHTD